MLQNKILLFGGLTGNHRGAEPFVIAVSEHLGIKPEVHLLAGHESYDRYHRSDAYDWVRGGHQAMRDVLSSTDVGSVAIVPFSTGILPGYAALRYALRHLPPERIFFLPVAPCFGLASTWDEVKLGTAATIAHGAPIAIAGYGLSQLLRSEPGSKRRAISALLFAVLWHRTARMILQKYKLPNLHAPEKKEVYVSEEFNVYGLMTLSYVKRAVRRLLQLEVKLRRVRTHVICGTSDGAIDIALVSKFAEVTGAKLSLLKDQGHGLILDPYAIGFAIEALREFLQQEHSSSLLS